MVESTWWFQPGAPSRGTTKNPLRAPLRIKARNVKSTGARESSLSNICERILEMRDADERLTRKEPVHAQYALLAERK